MRQLVTGAGGRLGRDTVEEPARRGEQVTGLDHAAALDITDPVSTMIRPEASRDTVDVVDDQRGRPTRSADVANRIADLGPRLGRDANGMFHATSSGETTWYELAHEVFRHLGADPDRVRPVGSAAFPRPAPRPAYSALAHDRRQQLALPPLRGWRTALHEALPEIRKESLRETP
jgi:dTDP-4-dehydrorhamnose reductase